MIQELIDSVQQFHQDKDIDFKQPMQEHVLSDMLCVKNAAFTMHMAAEACLKKYVKTPSDLRYLRLHLIMEECSELIKSMYEGDRLNTLDGMGDLMYVVAGSAIAFGWDLDGAVQEICKSNLTKCVSKGEDDPRLRDKGDTFEPPQLEQFLN